MMESIIKFAQKELGEGIVDLDRDSVFDKNRWKKFAEVGIQGLSMPTEYGGTPLNCLQAMLAMEALGYGCADNGLIFIILLILPPTLYLSLPQKLDSRRFNISLASSRNIHARGFLQTTPRL